MRQVGNLREPVAHGLFGRLEIVGDLKIGPKLRRLTERPAEKQGHFRGDGPGPLDDVGHPHRGKPDGSRKLGLTHPQLIEDFLEKHTGMNRGKVVFGIHALASLMVIDNFNVVSFSTVKPEADAPLVIDADTPLPGSVSRQCFQTVGWRHAKIVDGRGCVQLGQSPDRPFQNVRREMPGFSRGEKAFGFLVRECPDQGFIYKQYVYDCQDKKGCGTIRRNRT